MSERWDDPEYRAKHAAALDVYYTDEKRQEYADALRDASPENHPAWKGGRVTLGGYIRVRAPEHPRAQNGYVFEHVLIAERVLGRPLKYVGMGSGDNEVVHHINGDPSDNRKSNLLICTQSYHIALHQRQRAAT